MIPGEKGVAVLVNANLYPDEESAKKRANEYMELYGYRFTSTEAPQKEFWRLIPMSPEQADFYGCSSFWQMVSKPGRGARNCWVFYDVE
jgi:hypothetical protein